LGGTKLVQRGLRGDSGSPQSRGSLTGKLTPQKKAFVLKSAFDLLQCLEQSQLLKCLNFHEQASNQRLLERAEGKA